MSRGTTRLLTLVRWFKRALLAVLTLVLLYEGWLFGWVLWWRTINPDMTRFMELRLETLRVNDPKAALQQRWVAYEHISPHLKRALIAAEDSRFMQHDGFDWDGIEKALARNRRRGKIVAGGSTISQQLAKNLLLTPDKTLWRKAQEAVITLMIETTWSKRRILEVYLNVIEWGNGIFGAEAAAWHYFGVSATQLSAEQAARLAAMVPRPRYFDTHRTSPILAARSESIRRHMSAALIP